MNSKLNPRSGIWNLVLESGIDWGGIDPRSADSKFEEVKTVSRSFVAFVSGGMNSKNQIDEAIEKSSS